MGKNFREWSKRSDWTTICHNCNLEVPKGVMIERVGRGKYAHKFTFECGREVMPKIQMTSVELREIYTRLKNKIAIENWDIEGWANDFSSKEVIASIDEFRSKSDFAGIINLLDPERVLFPKPEFMSVVESQNLPINNSRITYYRSGLFDWFVRFHGSWVNQYLFSVAFELDGLSHARIISKPTNQVISTSPDGAYETVKRYNCIDLNELAEYKAICRLLENLGNEEYFTDCMHYVEQCTGAKSKIVRTIVDMAKTGRIDMDPHEHKDGYFIRGYRYLDPESLTPIDFRTNLN